MNAPASLAAPAAFIPRLAIVLWLGLLAASAVVLLAAGALAWWQRRRATPTRVPPVTPIRTRRPTLEDLSRLLAEVDALSIQAVSAGMAAADAQAAARTARARAGAAERAREWAWHEYDTAQQAYVRALRAGAAGEEVWPTASRSGAWPVLAAGGTEPGPERVAPAAGASTVAAAAQVHDEPGLRGEVARAALAAYRRGGISVEQLRQVLRHSSDGNQPHGRYEREVLLRRAAEREARRRYQATAAAERSAYQAVEVATVAARAWADEAADAAEDARLAQAFANDRLRRASTGRRPRRWGSLWRLRRRDEAPAPG